MSLVSLLIPCPRPSPLFPYTTLFRSQGARAPRQPERRAVLLLAVDRQAGPHRRHRGAGFRRGGRRVLRDPASRLPDWSLGVEDRKSTRLNSSHLGISYAVFCLKKKKE